MTIRDFGYEYEKVALNFQREDESNGQRKREKAPSTRRVLGRAAISSSARWSVGEGEGDQTKTGFEFSTGESKFFFAGFMKTITDTCDNTIGQSSDTVKMASKPEQPK